MNATNVFGIARTDLEPLCAMQRGSTKRRLSPFDGRQRGSNRSGGAPNCARLASDDGGDWKCAATIMLASTAKASPPTIPAFMQRETTVSNRLRRRASRENGHVGSWKTSNDREPRRRDPSDRTSGRPD
jgi:hypothetical protein